ncbi:hypothetical protein OSB04_006893 [Centaurea solstitialis]|uniref:Uncharacterized protein n=1 Tax=Centaurea solstitialis TaxID=347529 RepID=A0AA38TIS8_9ASTR|nr:hypothetical protein OSB04_006893 [Centaurea solstitialis]
MMMIWTPIFGPYSALHGCDRDGQQTGFDLGWADLDRKEVCYSKWANWFGPTLVRTEPGLLQEMVNPSHPSTHRIQEVLNKVQRWESISSSLSNPSAEIVCSGLSQLAELYECLDVLFKTSFSQNRSISSNCTKWTDELLDVSVKFLDICSTSTDVMMQKKDIVRDLECDLRRKGGSSIESIVAKYSVLRNKVRKDMKRSVASMKQMDNMTCRFTEDDSENHHLTSVIRVFREVKAFSITILRLLLAFLGTPILKRRPTSTWTTISRLLSSSKVVPQEQANDSNVNELQCLDAALFSTSEKQESMQILRKKMVALEAILEGINSHLNLVSKRFQEIDYFLSSRKIKAEYLVQHLLPVFHSIRFYFNDSDSSWVFFGDFNEVRFSKERKRSSFNRRGAKSIIKFIENLSLVEPALGGRKFTWSNLDGSKMSKLDQYQFSVEFGNL